MGRKAFKEAVAEIVSKNGRFTPAHVLLHSLNIPAVTTNYDNLYEKAGISVGKLTPCLPWDRCHLFDTDTGHSLLKLHGSVHDPDSIVLTRKDYNRFGDEREALRGMVASMMVEREILFVGFSMTDDNVHVIIDRVLKVCQEQEETDGWRRKLGTVLALVENAMFNEYWGEKFNVLSCGASWGDKPAWRHDCFLSCLAFGMKYHWPILSRQYTSLLMEPEQKLRKALLAVVSLGEQQEVKDTEVWQDTIEPFLVHLGLHISATAAGSPKAAVESSKAAIKEDLNTSSASASTGAGLGLTASEFDPQMSELAAAQDQCPQGHKLQEGVAPGKFSCNLCGEVFPARTRAYSCRSCDYDVCSKCLQAAKADEKPFRATYPGAHSTEGPWRPKGMPTGRSWQLARKYLAMIEFSKKVHSSAPVSKRGNSG